MSDQEEKIANTSKNNKDSSSANYNNQPKEKIEESPNKVEKSNDDDEEENISLSNLIERMDDEEKMREDADAVLGVADDDVCSYHNGYMKRQALYSCLTCQKEKGEDEKCLAGVCLACSFKCHEGHQLVELYTKRNFACDCGNNKFPQNFSCKLNPNKNDINEKNAYNHNFEGLYCNCGRPYPDPEEEEEEEMVQCVFCEDWFHPKHISPTLKADDYDEMTCDKCMCKYPFLYLYVPLCRAVSHSGHMANDNKNTKNDSFENNNNNKIINNGNNKNNTNEKNHEDEKINNITSIDVLTPSEDALGNCPLKQYHANNSNICNHTTVTNTTECSSSIATGKNDTFNHTNTNNESNINNTTNNISSINNMIKLGSTSDKGIETTPPTSSPVYWPANWRSFLCRCSSCLELYNEHSLSFLLDKEDSLREYEETGKQMRERKEGDSINKLSYVQKAELLQGYTDLKQNLTNYLRKFAENRKVVREEDISEFFEMQMRKKKKMNMQYFCK